MVTKNTLIKADWLTNSIADYVLTNAYLNDTSLDALKMVANWVRHAPSVDAVPVVRCRDCKHYVIRACACRHENFNGVIHSDGFCSYGERRTTND